MFSVIASILAPIFITAGIGYTWSRSGKGFDTRMVTAIVTYIGTPCLIFSALATVELDLTTLYDMGLAALYANILFAVVGGLILWLFKLPQRAFLQAICMPNVGNVGLPLCALAFGPEGLALAVGFFAIFVVFQMSIGVAFVSGSFSLKQLAKMPVIPATILACLFLVTETKVPGWLANTTDMIGKLTIPLMLITLGVSLNSLKVDDLKTAFRLAFVRLGMGFGVGVGLAWAMGLEGTARGVVILECAMPTAVFAYLFSQLYNQRPQEVAGVVVVSSFMGFVSLPLLLWFVL